MLEILKELNENELGDIFKSFRSKKDKKYWIAFSDFKHKLHEFYYAFLNHRESKPNGKKKKTEVLMPRKIIKNPILRIKNFQLRS
jgi:hypothetical protein